MIRFYGGRVLEHGIITENEVWVKDDSICYVGAKPEDLPAFEREYDLGGNLLMPGFKNAHAHSGMTFLRSAVDDYPLQEWLFGHVIPLEMKLTPENMLPFVKLAFLEYISNGITACFDSYRFYDVIVDLSREWGFRTVICDSLTPNNDWDDPYKYNEKYNNMGSFVSYVPGFHAEYTASEDMLKHLSKAAHDLKMPVFSHSSETKAEVDGCMERHGATPTKYLDGLGLYDYGGGGFHCVWMTDEDIEIYRQKGLTAVLNPCSNAKLASGIPQLSRFLKADVKLAIGTDGAASNNEMNIFREMYLANVLSKLYDREAASGDPAKVLDAAIAGGARAMWLFDCDDIAVGKKADMIVIDMMRPNMQPVHNIVKNLVYSGNPSDVKLTMIGGRVLYENGEFHLPDSVDSIYREVEKYSKQIVYG